MNICVGIAVILVALVLLFLLKEKITKGSSCCGEHEEALKSIPPRDTNPKNYPFHYLLRVEGMVCKNCAKRVENAFHQKGEYFAKVDLGKKEVHLASKRSLSRRETAQIVDEAGYTLMDFEE